MVNTQQINKANKNNGEKSMNLQCREERIGNLKKI